MTVLALLAPASPVIDHWTFDHWKEPLAFVLCSLEKRKL